MTVNRHLVIYTAFYDKCAVRECVYIEWQFHSFISLQRNSRRERNNYYQHWYNWSDARIQECARMRLCVGSWFAMNAFHVCMEIFVSNAIAHVAMNDTLFCFYKVFNRPVMIKIILLLMSTFFFSPHTHALVIAKCCFFLHHFWPGLKN